MASARDEILDWAEQGRIPQGKLRAALEEGGAIPSADQWRGFLDRLFLFMGAVLLGAGVIFFFAFNWQAMGRFAKFALVEAPVLLALFFVWRIGLDRLAGKAALLAGALVVGAVLALIGQTYQTGADTWELFAAWAVAILPWALVARFPALWIFWLLLANVAVSLYFITLGFWGMLFAPERLIWLLFGLNTTALLLWEGLALAGIEWLRERWSVRLLAIASGTLVTALAVLDIVNSDSHWGLPAWLAWVVAAYVVYRRLAKDLFVLSGGVLSAVVVVATLLGNSMRFNDAGSFLFIGLVVILISAAGGWWLKQVAQEEGES
jgi:uncharacterized membrane protein